MKKMSCAIAIVFSSALFSGCEPNRFVPSTQARDAVKSALQARRIGQIFDAGTRAIADDDMEKLARNCDELHQLKVTREADLLCLTAAENAVVEAVRLESVDRISSTRSARNTALATQKYRLALRLSPDFSSQNSMLLNALGYFLADLGDSNSDFVTAEKLTRRALQIDAKQLTNDLLRKSSEPISIAPTSAIRWRGRCFVRANSPQRSANKNKR